MRFQSKSFCCTLYRDIGFGTFLCLIEVIVFLDTKGKPSVPVLSFEMGELIICPVAAAMIFTEKTIIIYVILFKIYLFHDKQRGYE